MFKRRCQGLKFFLSCPVLQQMIWVHIHRVRRLKMILILVKTCWKSPSGVTLMKFQRTYVAEGAMECPLTLQRLTLLWNLIINHQQFDQIIGIQVGEEEAAAGKLQQRPLPTRTSLKAEVTQHQRKHYSDYVPTSNLWVEVMDVSFSRKEGSFFLGCKDGKAAGTNTKCDGKANSSH